jgi:hypothetical protein
MRSYVDRRNDCNTHPLMPMRALQARENVHAVRKLKIVADQELVCARIRHVAGPLNDSF